MNKGFNTLFPSLDMKEGEGKETFPVHPRLKFFPPEEKKLNQGAWLKLSFASSLKNLPYKLKVSGRIGKKV